jgi:hypothetical protein
MARAWEENSTGLWVKAVKALPPEPMKFAHASLNTLPTNANLHKWGKKVSDVCPLCRESRQSLPHILNNCAVAMELRRYSKRHDDVLKIFGDFIWDHLPPEFSITIDSESAPYMFPQHIITTDMRPDIVWWSDHLRELWLFELTISYESRVAEARQRKQAKYADLVEAGKVAGYRTELITIEVGSRGMVGIAEFDTLRAAINAPLKNTASLCVDIIRASLLGSFRVWGSRNIMI